MVAADFNESKRPMSLPAQPRADARGPDNRGSTRRQWHWFYLVLGIYLVAMSACASWRTESNYISDFKDFWTSATELARTGWVPYELVVQNYFPAFRVMTMPLALVSLPMAALLFTLLSGGLLAVGIGRLARTTAARKAAPWAVILALTFPYLHDTLAIGQTSLVVLFFIMVMWECLERRDERRAGLALCVATVLKIVPGILIVWLLVRGRRLAAVWGLATTALLVLALPTLTLGWRETVRAHQEFARVALVEHSVVGVLSADAPPRARFSNAALPIVLRRVLTPTDIDPVPGRPPRYVNVATVGLGVLVTLWIVISVSLLTVSIRSTRRSVRDGAGEMGTLRATADLGVWCCLLLLLSPVVSTHYLVLMVIPLVPSVLLCVAPSSAGSTRSARLAARAGLAWWVLGLIALLFPTARAMGASWFAVAGLWAANLAIARHATEGADRLATARDGQDGLDCRRRGLSRDIGRGMTVT